MASDLRRRVAEALDNWYVKFSKRVTFTLDEWDVYYNGTYLGSVEAANEAEAREAAVDLLPDWPIDPAAALALLAEARYTHEHYPSGMSPAPGMPAISDRVVIMDDKAHYAGNGDTFAQAACEAWASWREGA